MFKVWIAVIYTKVRIALFKFKAIDKLITDYASN